LNGYLNAMPEEQFLVMQMHELLTLLGRQGVVTLLIAAQHGMLGPAMGTPVDLSYLSDNVLLLRYFEAQGRIRKAISVLKRRRGAHETTIRELAMGATGLSFGAPLADFSGVLTGVPTYTGGSDPLLEANGDRGQ
jgi:circadian clock protein KaiC